VPDPTTQPAVRLILRLANESYTLVESAALLNRYGVPPPRATYWCPSTVRNVLVNVALRRAPSGAAMVTS
jgi:hypothetical protein